MSTRLCGSRKSGAAYLEVKLSETGKPVEYFLFDPAVPVDTQALGLSSVGVKPVSNSGVTYVFDIVGGSYYPNVADIIEETRYQGLSRRIPKTFPVELLSPESKIVLLHRRGYICNYHEYYDDVFNSRTYSRLCPTNNPDHMNPRKYPDEPCSGLWWHDIEEGAYYVESDDLFTSAVTRDLTDVPYRGWVRPAGVTPDYRTAIIAAFPIGNIAVVRDPVEGSHNEVLDLFKDAGVDVRLVDR